MSTAPNAEIRIWGVLDRRGAKGHNRRPWVVRWKVDGTRFQRVHRTRGEADRFRSRLLTAQQLGERFDSGTGEPASWNVQELIPVNEWVRRWLSENWAEWQPRSRTSAIEEMSRFLPLMVRLEAPPIDRDLRLYLVDALRPGNPIDGAVEAWVGKWCYNLTDLDRATLAEVDRLLGVGLKGQLLSQTTARRYRNTAKSCIKRAVDLGLLDRDPWPPPIRGAKNRKVRRTSKAIDIKRLPDPPTLDRALEAIRSHQPASRQYQVMTAIMALGGLRPSEVVMLRPRALHLPAQGWGAIDVTEADIDFDEPGDPKTGNRIVPIPAQLVAILQDWLDAHRFKPDSLIFRTRHNNRPSQSNWGRSWHRALENIGHERLRLYDCRHTAATTWLSAGVPLGETARRMGHSVETLVAVYVGALQGDEQSGNQAIDDYINSYCQPRADD